MASRWQGKGRGPTPAASILPLNAHTVCDLLFNFTSSLAFMRVIYKALGFDPQHKKSKLLCLQMSPGIREPLKSPPCRQHPPSFPSKGSLSLGALARAWGPSFGVEVAPMSG